jgi:hypothetical protein
MTIPGLGLPQIDSVLAQDVEQSVVLCGGHRKFEDVADEIGEDRAASPTLRIQVTDVGRRHVIFELQRIIPVQISI